MDERPETRVSGGARPSDRGAPRRRRWWRPLIILGAVVAAAIAARHLGLFELLSVERLDRIDGFFENLGWWAPAVFVLLWIAACVLLLPGLPISIAGGLIFGAVWGSVWTTIGANLGAAAAFLIARHAARSNVERMVERSPGLRRLDDGVRRHGWRMLVVTRLVPAFPFNLQNYAYGLTDMPLRTYVLVNLPTMLPATIAYNFAAGSVRTGEFSTALWYLGIAALVFVLLSLLPGWLRDRFGGDDAEASVTEE